VHHGLLATFTSSAGLIRRTEEEADVEALYLIALAGYDYTKAPAFWKRFGDKTGAGIFSDGTHPRTKARVALAEATVARIRAQIAAGQQPLPPVPLLPDPPSQDQKSR
ncbi:MAG: peptidase M48, Ste24p, partial [Alphaproteobacteria bacterium]|nr:peptidase M48, Ste24p [Alphaproteobacteria bacterium]